MIRTIWRGCHWVADRWCYAMHPKAMWPIGSRYSCAKCGRRYPVPWVNCRPTVPVGEAKCEASLAQQRPTASDNPAPSEVVRDSLAA